MRLLLQILWGKQGKWQFLFAVGGFLVGLIIMLISVQLYVDVEDVLGGKDMDDPKSYIIIHKSVTLMNTFDKSLSQFKPEELDSLRSQPFISRIGEFKTSTFKMNAEMQDQLGFAVDLFFESVPTDFLDTVPEDFTWNEGEDFIPILISSEFLRLYNFGVAMTQRGMPQLPKEAVQQFPFDVTISGRGLSKTYKSRVVGYTDRVPSVLVPEEFLEFANKTYGKGAAAPASRIMLEIDDPGDENLQAYLKSHFYETNQEQLRISNMSKIVKLLVALAGIIGLSFVIMSFVIFVINFQLIISRAKQEINLLLDIGYKQSTISNILTVQFVVVLSLVLLIAYVAVYALMQHMHAFAATYGIVVTTPFSPWVLVTGALSTIAILLITRFTLWMSLK